MLLDKDTLCIFTDASGYRIQKYPFKQIGYGGFHIYYRKEIIHRQYFPGYSDCIDIMEIMSVKKSLEFMILLLQNTDIRVSDIKIFTDSYTAMDAVENKSKEFILDTYNFGLLKKEIKYSLKTYAIKGHCRSCDMLSINKFKRYFKERNKFEYRNRPNISEYKIFIENNRSIDLAVRELSSKLYEECLSSINIKLPEYRKNNKKEGYIKW